MEYNASGCIGKLFVKEVLRRDRACPCPDLKEDSHKGCPYDFENLM